MDNWNLITNAPKDGTEVLVFDGVKKTTAYYDQSYGSWELVVPSDGYVDSNEVYPTHWMHLPADPKGDK